MLDFGMPMGPLRLLDEIGLDVAMHVSHTMEDAYGERLAAPAILHRLTGAGRLGKKSGAASTIIAARAGRGAQPEADPDVAGGDRSTSLPPHGRRGATLSRGRRRRFRGGYRFRDGLWHGLRVVSWRSVAIRRSLGHVRKQSEVRRDEGSKSVIDTSKMSAEERAALELTEAARTEAGKRNSLAGSFFMGAPDFRHVFPFPEQGKEDRDQGDAFVQRLRQFLATSVDPDAIDRDGEIPQAVLDGLAKMGAFGIKIPGRYGGLGLSQTNYSRAAMCLGGVCGNLTALLSAHQSIGVPQPLIMFGAEEQKERYLPRMAEGEISAFALTEPEVGSDPAKMRTVARRVDGGKFFEISGEKLWCTNGTKAGLLVVMAKVLDSPDDALKPESARTITAFIVEANSPE